MDERVFLQRHLHEEFGKVVLFRINAGGFGVATEKVQRKRLSEVEIQRSQDIQLHGTNLRRSIGVVSDVDKVVNFRRVHLLIFGGDPHAADADQLKLLALDGDEALGQITIQDGDRQIQGFLQKTELLVDLRKQDGIRQIQGFLQKTESLVDLRNQDGIRQIQGFL